MSNIVTSHAIKLYDIYTAAVGGKSWDGKPLPSGEEFINDPTKQTQANAWRAVAAHALGTGTRNMPTCNLSFSEALIHLKCGAAVRLPHWSPEVHIKLQTPDTNSKMTAPYLYVESRYGRVPWVVTQIELLSTDWELAAE